jgi:hypothetical protein
VGFNIKKAFNWNIDGKLTLEILGVLLVNEIGKVTTVIEDHVQGLSIRESSESLLNAPVVLFLGLALPCEDRDTSRSNAVVIASQYIRKKKITEY